jgi:cullin-associated NEDD8-dissociated protein 1
MVSNNEQLRDVSSIALKTVIAELPPSTQSLTTNVTRRVTPKLTAAAGNASTTDVSVRLEVLDILGEIVLRYGNSLQSFHADVRIVVICL